MPRSASETTPARPVRRSSMRIPKYIDHAAGVGVPVPADPVFPRAGMSPRWGSLDWCLICGMLVEMIAIRRDHRRPGRRLPGSRLPPDFSASLAAVQIAVVRADLAAKQVLFRADVSSGDDQLPIVTSRGDTAMKSFSESKR